jgi:hypothetical protein
MVLHPLHLVKIISILTGTIVEALLVDINISSIHPIAEINLGAAEALEVITNSNSGRTEFNRTATHVAMLRS